MADLPPQSDSPSVGSADTGFARGAEPPTGTLRWVKAFGVIAVVVVVLVVVLLLVGGGNHGPARHTGHVEGGQTAPTSGVVESAAGSRASRAAGRARR